jgi:2-dehydro-3-deoxyglucarate aldolase/4-hydroxy-2-oxoheptanedioate aldolase
MGADMITSIKERLARGETVRVMVLGALASPKLIEIAGLHAGLHGVWIDQEHSAIPHHELELMIMACRASGLDAFARVPPTDYGTIMRPMEAGAGGIMVAQIRTVDQVRQVLEWAKYPPQGVRGLFMNNYEAGYGTANVKAHVVKSNRDRWLCIQVETPEAVECAGEIAALDGVDHLFVGTADLACTLGVPGEMLHEKCVAALAKVAEAVQRAGKTWGALVRSPEHADQCRKLGCTLFSLMGDLDVVHRGIKAVRTVYGDYFE